MNDKEITREEIEKTIRYLLEDIWSEYRKYNPEGEYLDLCLLIADDGQFSVSANNRYWAGGKDEKRPVFLHYRREVEE